ncbi:hypothetical protein C5F44_16835 [Fuscovulum blasticum DSM 2131]|uniref:Uncharacterized protein n=2 Tax=Fuscovulum blasticum TaxID=1075 RepID=A0A2T4J4H9_FUSBL|nr:hypothetical protein C5F44_16835 [Fuscovulum blasticum DSM 2131]
MAETESRSAPVASPMSFVSLIGIYAAVFAAMIALLLPITHFVALGLGTAVFNILLIRLGLRFGARQSMKTLPKG